MVMVENENAYVRPSQRTGSTSSFTEVFMTAAEMRLPVAQRKQAIKDALEYDPLNGIRGQPL